jgi:hypothetical protein
MARLIEIFFFFLHQQIQKINSIITSNKVSHIVALLLPTLVFYHHCFSFLECYLIPRTFVSKFDSRGKGVSQYNVDGNVLTQ